MGLVCPAICQGPLQSGDNRVLRGDIAEHQAFDGGSDEKGAAGQQGCLCPRREGQHRQHSPE